MSAITFENYSVATHGLEGIYAIGDGVAEEMATAFGHDLSPEPDVDNLGELISRVGPAKELQANIHGVQEALGTSREAVDIARDWVERSGLLIPVERSYLTAEQLTGPIEVAVITGGVRNWMMRRAERLEKLHEERGVENVLLIAGNRKMKTGEGPDVDEDMTEFSYIVTVVGERLAKNGLSVVHAGSLSTDGDQVMADAVKGASLIANLITLETERVAVVSNAGAWVQNAGQMRRAIRGSIFTPGFDRDGRQIEVVSDGFELGTGTEPTATHQNPFSALGQIVRNLQELTRQQQL